jgi:RimJ/RimL family protein N-acetyltransferase
VTRTHETERLILRPWRDEDLAPFAALNADPRVMEHFPSTLSGERSDHVAGLIRGFLEEHGYGLWAVEVKGGAPFVGFVGLSIPAFEAAFTPCVEVGWRLAAEAWGRGYATEAARESLRVGFEELALDEIVSFTTPRNRASIRVMEKIGMRRDPGGDFGHPRVPEDHPLHRHVLYRLRSDAWREAAARAPEPR